MSDRTKRGHRMPPHWRPERNASMVRMREGGATYDAIAEHFGVSRERVRQIVIRDTGRGGERRP